MSHVPYRWTVAWAALRPHQRLERKPFWWCWRERGTRERDCRRQLDRWEVICLSPVFSLSSRHLGQCRGAFKRLGCSCMMLWPFYLSNRLTLQWQRDMEWRGWRGGGGKRRRIREMSQWTGEEQWGIRDNKRDLQPRGCGLQAECVFGQVLSR